jgi:hypothetical protein
LVPNPATAEEFVAEEFVDEGRDELTLDTGSSAFFVCGRRLVLSRPLRDRRPEVSLRA